jgi:hypothetical protein
MNTPFNLGYRITQEFGENPATYKPFGFNGHEGVDLIPATDDEDVLAIEEGIVVRDEDIPFNISDPNHNYGEYLTILNPQTKRAWWYCHLDPNFCSIGNKIARGQKIGIYGSTGNVTGRHLHLGLRLADDSGDVINTDNGYKGFVDPLPALISFNSNIGQNQPISQSVADSSTSPVPEVPQTLPSKVDQTPFTATVQPKVAVSTLNPPLTENTPIQSTETTVSSDTDDNSNLPIPVEAVPEVQKATEIPIVTYDPKMASLERFLRVLTGQLPSLVAAIGNNSGILHLPTWVVPVLVMAGAVAVAIDKFVRDMYGK